MKQVVATETALKYTTADESGSDKVSAIIVCGGSSSRMNGIDKMFAEIKGIPVCVRSIAAFQKCDRISNIVVAAREDSILKLQQLCEKYELSKVTDIVSGGNCRQRSVANGLARLTDDTGIVLVHDGARPFVTEECILRVINGSAENSAVTCAVKLKDTVKCVRTDGLVTATPDRNGLAAVQTPQGFKYELYRSAVTANYEELENFTDDCSVVEAFGYPVYIVDGDYRNIKITTAEDLKIAEIFAEDEV